MNPSHCDPFPKTIDKTNYYVSKLINLFDRSAKIREHEQSTGRELGTGTLLVVPLTGTLQDYVQAHLISEGILEDDTARKIQQQSVWYGIVDGNHFNRAIRYILREKREWKMRPGLSLS